MSPLSGMPAEKAGISAEDIVVKLDGQSLKDVDGGLAKVIAARKAGDTVEVELWRNGETKMMRVVLEGAE